MLVQNPTVWLPPTPVKVAVWPVALLPMDCQYDPLTIVWVAPVSTIRVIGRYGPKGLVLAQTVAWSCPSTIVPWMLSHPDHGAPLLTVGEAVAGVVALVLVVADRLGVDKGLSPGGVTACVGLGEDVFLCTGAGVTMRGF